MMKVLLFFEETKSRKETLALGFFPALLTALWSATLNLRNMERLLTAIF
ncbi:hypothetical protein B0H99_106183 [Planomicrobium soli]|uniref:Uncharacterized protein n=1 Tax=Planomicrobium soli TaxID=1176648 RepID=A0A2P8H1T0_9BACL|nr:hypothetical protein B0H99_106183 [Planomicrobium soli]